MIRVILIFIVLLSLLPHKVISREVCSEKQGDNFGIILTSIKDRNYQKFTKYIDCLDDVNFLDSNGISLLMYTVGYVEVLSSPSSDVLYRSGRKKNFIDPQIFVSELLKRGSDPNLQDEDGNTALSTAVYHNYLGSAWLLLKYGGDPNNIEDINLSPLMVASVQCHHNMYELLLSFGGKPDLKNKLNDSAENLYKKCTSKQ